MNTISSIIFCSTYYKEHQPLFLIKTENNIQIAHGPINTTMKFASMESYVIISYGTEPAQGYNLIQMEIDTHAVLLCMPTFIYIG